MPQSPHVEQHFTGNAVVRDAVIGMSDGLTVPFALAAGLSAATASVHVVVIGGLAEIAAGSISMGLGGYLAARSDLDYYRSERRREQRQLAQTTEYEAGQLERILAGLGFAEDDVEAAGRALRTRPQAFADFMMRLELGLRAPDPRRAVASALTIGGAYAVGGAIPLLPYVLAGDVLTGLTWSVVATAIALFAFGAVKGRFTGVSPARSAVQTLVVGGLAAAAAFGLGRLI